MASYEQKKPESRLFIGGRFVESRSGKRFNIYNPATEELAATVYEAGAEDVDDAVKAAQAAFEGWEELGASCRTGILLKLADAIEAHAEELDYLDAICMGKPISDCKTECPSSTTYTDMLRCQQSAMPGLPPFVSVTMRTRQWTCRGQVH